MTTPDIRPVTDPEARLPVCSVSCPQWDHICSGYCLLGEEGDCGDLCPHAVRRMAIELEQAKALIARLPLDAVGKPLIPSVDSVWIVCEGGAGWMEDVGHDDGVCSYRTLAFHGDHWAFEIGCETAWWDGQVYLEKSDAEAAQGAEE